MINGIKIGTVVGLKLDNENYDAEIKLSIAPDVKLPEDSVATIATNGLMGNKFIKVEPGKSKEILQNGDEITNTKDFKTLEDMVGEVIFMVTGDDDKE
jgi:phospholipid/cholesterol/gamma-HCH transport system substrate-binding protein